MPGGTSLPRTDTVEIERKGDVLDCGQAGEEVELLEDVSHCAPAQPRLVVVRHRLHRDAIDKHLSARRLLETAGDGEQGRLSRPARAHDSDEMATIDGQVDMGERLDERRIGAVRLRDVAQFKVAHQHTP